MCDKYYLASSFRGVISGEQFCRRDEESCTFGSDGRVEFELKVRFIYLQDNTMEYFQYMCFDTKTHLDTSGDPGCKWISQWENGEEILTRHGKTENRNE